MFGNIRLLSTSTSLPPHLLVQTVFATYLLNGTFSFPGLTHACCQREDRGSVNTLAETWSNTAHTTNSSQQQCQYLVYSLYQFWERPTSFFKQL